VHSFIAAVLSLLITELAIVEADIDTEEGAAVRFLIALNRSYFGSALLLLLLVEFSVLTVLALDITDDEMGACLLWRLAFVLMVAFLELDVEVRVR